MGKVYVFYAEIPKDIFDTTYKYILSNTNSSASYQIKNDKVYILYAWTKNKQYAVEFKDVRPDDVFTLKIYDEDDLEDIDRFTLTKETKLDIHKFVKYSDDEVTLLGILTTLDEYKVIKAEFVECFEEHFRPDLLCDKTPPYILKSDIWLALQVLGYTSAYYGYHGTTNEADAASYNNSFGLSAEGDTLELIPNDTYDEVEALIYVFKYFFHGKVD